MTRSQYNSFIANLIFFNDLGLVDDLNMREAMAKAADYAESAIADTIGSSPEAIQLLAEAVANSQTIIDLVAEKQSIDEKNQQNGYQGIDNAGDINTLGNIILPLAKYIRLRKTGQTIDLTVDFINGLEKQDNKNIANGYLGLGNNGRASSNQLPANILYDSLLNAANGILQLGSEAKASANQLPTNIQYQTQKNQANGYVGLDANVKIAIAMLSLLIDDSVANATNKTWSSSNIVDYQAQGILTETNARIAADANKADLVAGKHTAAQSRATTLTYDSSTAVLTHTDAAGTVTTIDLPIENLFQNANYNSTTKELTLTTNGAGTVVISLADLVDIAEIQVSASSNPGGIPSTGQRLYLRADNGNYWIASAGIWNGPFLGVTSAEKSTWNAKQDAITNTIWGAILSSFGAKTTPVDADVTEFSDSADSGKAKKVTWANIKATLKNYFDTVYLSLIGGSLTGALNEAPYVTIASATSTTIGAAASNNVIVSGTTTITSFDSIAGGATRKVKFSGALILTYNATTLILPTSANITTVADDEAVFISLGSGNWKCISYTRKDGTALAGSSSLSETALSTIQNSATTETTTYVSPRRFWSGITQFLTQACTFSNTITVNVIQTVASTSSKALMNFADGVAKTTSLSSGDFWRVGINLFFRSASYTAKFMWQDQPNDTFAGAAAAGIQVDTVGTLSRIAFTNIVTGQTTLVAGTIAITITGLTTSSLCLGLVIAVTGGTQGTIYKGVCTSNTLTITAINTSGTIITTDTSTLNYIVQV